MKFSGKRSAKTTPTARSRRSGQAKGEALSDGEVVRRIRAGEIALFELLYRRYHQRIYRVARAIVRDDAEAADVVQESYLRAYSHLDQFAGRARFSTWLTRIAVHVARRRARRLSRQPANDAVLANPRGGIEREIATEVDPERQAFGKEVKTILEAAIEALPDRYRTVFMMREIEEMSIAETAECLKLSRDSVKTRLHRARILLRELVYASAGSGGGSAFWFAGSRCERILATVLVRMSSRRTK
jgi:RNA polymerase sigma-70 factor (ECF subfamily)